MIWSTFTVIFPLLVHHKLNVQLTTEKRYVHEGCNRDRSVFGESLVLTHNYNGYNVVTGMTASIPPWYKLKRLINLSVHYTGTSIPFFFSIFFSLSLFSLLLFSVPDLWASDRRHSRHASVGGGMTNQLDPSEYISYYNLL